VRVNVRKHSHIELFINRTADLYLGETRIVVVTNEGNQLIGFGGKCNTSPENVS